MAADDTGSIRGLATGVPGLDVVLGGGLPEYSFNLIAGSPGAGKTTLVQQIAFANATRERPALYFTVLGEPTLKMLRYQRQYAFFDRAAIGSRIHYINLSEEALERDVGVVLERIIAEVERAQPGIVVVDSFRTLGGPGAAGAAPGVMAIDHFVQRLALHLTTWETTSFLIGEYDEHEQRNPVFTVADGVLWLSQVTDRNSVVRKLQVVKARGRAPMPGLHTYRITDGGVQIFPRIPEQQASRRPQSGERLATGVPGLDEMMGGGVPAGDALMIAGPAGSGKTTFATQFVTEGLERGETAVIVVFEEYPEEYLARAERRGQRLEEQVRAGRLEILYLRPLDLSVDETLAEILDVVQRLGPARVVIDSLSGFQVALAPAFREDFRESLYRLVGALTAAGVTVIMTYESPGSTADLHFTSEKVSFITDDIIALRYVELGGELQRVLAVVKMRGSAHGTEFRTYAIGARGAAIGGALRNYQGILTGAPRLLQHPGRPGRSGLSEREVALLEALIRLGGASPGALAARTGVPVAEVGPALVRLQSQGYAAEHDGTYRALAQLDE